MVQQPRQFLGLQSIRRFGEARDIRKEDGQLLPTTRDFDFLLSGEDGLVYLWREVFRELARELLQSLCLVRQLVLTLLQFGDVGVDRHRAAVVGLALADQDPSTVPALLDVRATRFSVTGHPFSNPFLDPTLGILDVRSLGGTSNDAFVSHSRRYLWRLARIEESSILIIAHHEAIIGIIKREGL